MKSGCHPLPGEAGKSNNDGQRLLSKAGITRCTSTTSAGLYISTAYTVGCRSSMAPYAIHCATVTPVV